MPVARQSSSVLAKIASGGGQSFGVPSTWMAATYGSGWPIAPVEAPKDTALPRSIDYPIAVNTTLVPRISYGLMPFASLDAAYETVAECKIPVGLITRELMSFVPRLVGKDGIAIQDHPYAWMTKSPDRRVPFGVWQTRFLKAAKVYDAAAAYLQRDSSGAVSALKYIDGSTLFLIIDEYGDIPAPDRIDDYIAHTAESGRTTRTLAAPKDSPTPLASLKDFIELYVRRAQQGLPVPMKVPAYTQVIKGTPFAWWSADDIWYMPQSPRIGSPYGESFIEQAWAWIMIIVQLTAFELGHYRTGNMPEGFVTLPPSWMATPTQLEALEAAFNARMSNNPATERQRLRFFPDGSKYTATKKEDFPADLYRTAWRVVLNTSGIPGSEVGDMPGQGLGGKGIKDSASTELGRNTLNPHRLYVTSLFNHVLETDGVDDAWFELSYPVEEVDPDKKKQAVYEGMAHGTLTLNDALGQLNMNAVGDPGDKDNIANKHLIVAGATIYVVEDMKVQDAQATPSFPLGAPPPGAPTPGKTGGSPAPTEPSEAEHTPEDFATLRETIKNIIDRGKLTSKTISIPSGITKLTKVDTTHNDGCMIAVMIPQTVAQQLRTITEGLNLPSTSKLERAEDMHVTLAHLPDYAAAVAKRENLLSVLKQSAATSQTLSGRIQGYGIFNGKDSMNVLFALLDEPQLTFLRNEVCKGLTNENIEYSKDYGFVPHITLAYFPNTWSLPHGFSIPDMPVQIASICLCLGQESTLAPLEPKISQARAGYTNEASNHAEQCAKCRYFTDGGCELVAGTISPLGWCTFFERSLVKLNPNHGPDGKFTSGDGGGDAKLPSDEEKYWAAQAQPDLNELPDDEEGYFAAEAARTLDEGDPEKAKYIKEADKIASEMARQNKKFIPGKAFADKLKSKGLKPIKNTGEQEFENPAPLPGSIKKTDSLTKHCGVCPEDEEYYKAPVIHETQLSFPKDNHANGVEVVSIGNPPKAALWKPEDDEHSGLQSSIGGPQYTREEAAYLLDRCLEFMLVPVAYVDEVDGKKGAVLYYSPDAVKGGDFKDYDDEWVEKAAVFDFVTNQRDRQAVGHNYLTHPDEPKRMILIDNGMSFPVNPDKHCHSGFCDVWNDKSLSSDILTALAKCNDDKETWSKIADLVGTEASQNAKDRLESLLAAKELQKANPEGKNQFGPPWKKDIDVAGKNFVTPILSSKEANALNKYRDDSDEINLALRTDEVVDNTTFNRIKTIDSVIAKSVVTSDIEVHRGVGEDLLEHLKPGTEFTDNGFVSTTATEAIAKKFSGQEGGLIKLTIPKGANALHIDSAESSIGKLGNAENEILLPRGSSFRVSRIEDGPGELKIIHAELVR